MLYSRNKNFFIFTLVILKVLIFTVSGDDQHATEKNATCEKIQSAEFPEDLFSQSQRKCGVIILHLIFAIHCFGAIALVCSQRFLPTINCICEDLNLSDDVAAATFMSIATSAPELFSNIIGTFITESDIGIGHVIGNGYYNMFFVPALGGLVASKEIILEWWPLARDCSIYALVALTLTGIVWDGTIVIYEPVILLVLYFVYFFIMFNNKKISSLILKKFNHNEPVNSLQNGGKAEINSIVSNKEQMQEKKDMEETVPLEEELDFTLPPPPSLPYPKAENERWKITKKVITMPINFLIRYTIPDVRERKFRKYYPLTFVICVAWIGISTYLGTWMVSIIGKTIGVSELIMGMVFMAAGGSVVEAYAVYYKAKRGECRIGLSNSVGCNNLDVTLCLALPWFIRTLPIQISCKSNSSKIVLESSLIHLNCLLLVISDIALYVILYLNKFTLNKKLSFICACTYVLLLFIGISIEGYGQGVS